VFVVVPSYNHAPFIERCLKSIIKQTFQPKKLLVIDDGSQDDSPEIIARVLQDCPFSSELVVRPNRGLCATLNESVEQATGKYFAYLGSDDMWLPRFIEERVRLLESRPEAVLGYGHAHFIDDEDGVYDSTLVYADSWANFPDGDARSLLLKGNAPISSTIFYRRSALEKHRWNEESRLEDYEFYLKLCAEGDFAFDPQVLSAWRTHGYNTSRNKMLMLNEVIAAQKRNAARLGIKPGELEEIQERVKFQFASDFLHDGYKRDAFKIALENWRGASSSLALLKIALRFLLPMPVVHWRRGLRRKNAMAQFGSIEI
ncbi:MAG TPA: glycosyltransferase, partial [Pyrinomonadaceae bacterium]|nr:glycosyltransferase [Pyrinomonadaceae bacterium]